MISRRKALAGMAGVGAASLLTSGKVLAAPNFKVKMVTAWPRRLPVLDEATHMFASLVSEATGGDMSIQVHPAGDLVPGNEVFDTVSRGGMAEMGVGYPTNWSNKVPAAPLFGSVPFGMSARHTNAWLASGGQKLWEELFAKSNLVPMSIGNSGPNMAGWYTKKIGSVADLKGLKIYAPGLGGQVMKKIGAAVNNGIAPDRVSSELGGSLDAVQGFMPAADEAGLFFQYAPFGYYSGWQAPSANFGLIINKAAWDNFPKRHQAVIRSVAAHVSQWTLGKADSANSAALARIAKSQAAKVEILPLPTTVMSALKKHSDEVLNGLAAGDPFFKKVLGDYQRFRQSVEPWAKLTKS